MNIMENESNRRSSCENKALSIIMLGIENFKILHSTYGTQVSDFIQKQTALLLRQILLSTETVGSCGNGEFLLVLPNTDYCGACELAKKFHSIIKMKAFTELHFQITVTTSITTWEIPRGIEPVPAAVDSGCDNSLLIQQFVRQTRTCEKDAMAK